MPTGRLAVAASFGWGDEVIFKSSNDERGGHRKCPVKLFEGEITDIALSRDR